MLPSMSPESIVHAAPPAVSDEILERARALIEEVRVGGVDSLLGLRARFDGVAEDQALLLERGELEAALTRVDAEFVAVLRRSAARIASFADAQRACLTDLTTEIPGGQAGHRVTPLARAACYAPGGRYPLPSSVLMTAVTARSAGVGHVVVVTPSRDPAMLAAAYIAGADQVLIAGGAHAIAACAYGIGLESVDIIVGPGNAWVTAGKQLVQSEVEIDMLAGPSELVIVADDSACPVMVAADLLAQAEHDALARPILITTCPHLAESVRAELEVQLRELPTREVASSALCRGGLVVVDDLNAACVLSDQLAPEHLELLVRDPEGCAERVQFYGAIFLGPKSAEVFGDYAAGPNHVLPTGGSARRSGGLSVLTFLRVRSWLKIGEVDPRFCSDVSAMARYEGLLGHAKAAEIRSKLSVRNRG